MLRSSREPTFTATIADWIQTRGEVLALFRWPNAGGSKSFEFFRDVPAFMSRLASLPERTSIIVFREPQLPLRGAIDDDLIKRALDLIPDSTEYLIVGLDLVTCGSASWYPERAGETHQQLVADLREWWPGHRVAVGRYPPWLEDGASVISAYVPDVDGSVHSAAY